jgi:hypothetical protein
MFSPRSRYHGLETTVLQRPGREPVVYVRRRLLPTEPPATVLAEHVVVQGDRIDNVTARYLGDPEQYWRICDANDADRPADLTSEDQLGAVVVVPVPDKGVGP